MPVYVTLIEFQDDYTGQLSGHGTDPGAPQLMGVVGDFMYVKINFNVAWNLLGVTMTFNSTYNTISLDNCSPLSFNPLNLTSSNNTPALNSFINSTGYNSFINAGFQVGDTIVIQGTLGGINDGTYTILSLTDTVITTTQSIPSTGIFANVNIYGATAINALDFYYNMVGNNDTNTFVSLSDSQTVQRFTGLTTPEYYYGATFTLAPNATSLAWNIATVDGITCVPTVTDLGVTATYQQQYSLVFPFLITPLFLSDQLPQIQTSLGQTQSINGDSFTVPSYFTNECLKFIYQIDAKFNVIEPIADHSSKLTTTFANGNTAWFDTFFATGVKFNNTFITKPQYILTSTTYTNGSAVVIGAIDINNVTNVAIDLAHIGGSMTSGAYVLNFCWLPVNPGSYQNFSHEDEITYRAAFIHDRCRTYIGNVPSNGDMFGTSLQVLQNVFTTPLLGGIQVNFQVNFGSLAKSTFTNSNRNYMIWITPQSPYVNILEDTDRTAVIADVNVATINTDDSTQLSIIGGQLNFYQYPDTYIAYSSFAGFPGQYGLMKCDFLVPLGSIVQSMQTNIIVQTFNPSTPTITVSSFVLDSFSSNTSSFFDGNITQVSINQSRNFNLPTGTLYNTASINRYPTLDVSGHYALEILYGFQIGYQYWQNVSPFDPMFLTYHTQYWPVYTQGYANGKTTKSVWTSTQHSRIVMQQIWNILNPATGITTQFIQYANIYANDQIKGTNTVIDTQDGFGNSLNGLFANDAPTTIQAIVSGSTQPAGSTLEASITVTYNNGSGIVYDTLSTLDSGPETSTSLWTGVLTAIQYDANDVIITGVIDLSQATFPVSNVSVTATVWYVPGGSTFIITDGGINISDDSGNLFITG